MGIGRRDFLVASAAMAGSAATRSGHVAESLGLGPARTRAAGDAGVRSLLAGNITCVRTPDAGDGPFYYPNSPLRSDLAEGRPGLPLKLRIQVADAALTPFIKNVRCAAVPGVLVDVWMADGQGQYSNVGADIQSQGTVGKTFLRGHQATDQDGVVQFNAVVPGWELVAEPDPLKQILRTCHIHVKIHMRTTVATALLYFPNKFLDQLYASVEPYSRCRLMSAPGIEAPVARIRNEQDALYVTDRSRPMKVTREGGLASATAIIGLT